MEFDLAADGTLTPLPKQNIDTGMGLERGAMLLQDVPTIFDTDGFRLIMDWIERESGVAYGVSPDGDKAHRVLCDHGRGMTFLAAEGITPSNEGRGYVLRRLIRRAVTQARRIGLEDVYRLHAVVAEQVGPWYPEVVEHAEEVERVAARGGGALPRDARAGPARVRGAGRPAGDLRRAGVPPRRHVRLPDRADRRAGARARAGGGRGRLPRRDGAPPGDLARDRRPGRRSSGAASSRAGPASRRTSSAGRRPTC